MSSMKTQCLAFLPRPLSEEKRALLQGIHSRKMLQVICRHLTTGWTLVAVELPLRGCRLDVVAKRDLTRVVEVKSSKMIKQSHRIQAACQSPFFEADQFCVSNGHLTEVLDHGFISDALAAVETTYRLLTTDASQARNSTPDFDETCYLCGNTRCPNLRSTVRR